MKFSEKLKLQYLEQMRQWPEPRFEQIEVDEPEEGTRYEQAWIGTVFGLLPSGKYYTFWTTNQTCRDVVKDSAWWEAFETYLAEKGRYQADSEGCGSDICIGRTVNLTVL